METQNKIEFQTWQKFGPNGCLRFPEILMRFDLSREADPDVTAHLRSCSRCWKLFDSAIHADAELVKKTMPDDSYPGERCAELESLIYDDMFSGVRDNGIIWRIYGLSRKLDENEQVYLQGYLKFLSYTSTVAMERAKLLKEILDGSGTLVFFNEDDGEDEDSEAVPYLIKKRIDSDSGRKTRPDIVQIAAGDSDSNFVQKTVRLSNGWECEITYRGGGRDTELKLNCGGAKPPVLWYCALPDKPMELPMSFEKLKRSAIMGGKSVYKLAGDQPAEIVIPGVPESLTVHTIKHA